MKELSIEQKAKAYDEALKVLHKYDGANIMFTQDLKEEIFPELKESDGERMIQYFKDLAPFDKADELYEKYGFSHKDALAWLEKQGEKHIDKELSKLLNRVICLFINNPLIPYSERDEVSKKIIPYVEQLEKQCEQKPADKVESGQEELTEFEKAVKQVMEEAIECGDTHNLKADADMLLRLVIL